jgi:integrase/recombinase XerC
MSEATDNFLHYLLFEKRLSRHTVEAYSNDLKQLCLFLETKEMVVEEADKNALRSWVVNLAEQKLSPVSINRKMAAIKAFYRFLKKKGRITMDPSTLLIPMKKPRKLPGFVEESSMELLFDAIGFEDSKSGRRDQLVIEILYGTGMRLSELIGLKVGDVNVYDRTLKVMGKRSKQRIIPATNGLIGLITAYLAERGPVSPAEPLLLTDKDAPLYPVFVQRLVRKYLSAVTSIDHKSPHLLRHTYATHLLNRGADLNAIKELLGHASLAATQIYTHNAIEELKRTFLQAHPKA